MTLELLRTIIIGVGWPLLLGASVYILIKSVQFYRDVKGTPSGKLVLTSVIGWLITMYSLGIVATFYLYQDLSAVSVIVPVFIAWFTTLVIIIVVIVRWNKEARTQYAAYTGLEKEVERRANKLENAYKRERERDQELQKLKDEFLFTAAHEFRSPVNAMKWGIDALLGDKELMAKLPPEAKETVESIRDRNNRLRSLVTRLLDTARLEQGTLTIQKEKVNLYALTEEIFDEVQHLTAEYTIALENKLDNVPPVDADPTLVKDALTNFITNAIRYNEEHGRVTVGETHTDDEVTLFVEDTGTGIPKDQMEHVFKKFHHVQHGAKIGKEKSVGLGLYITKELITRMGGSVHAESEVGKGSIFSLTLPRWTE